MLPAVLAELPKKVLLVTVAEREPPMAPPKGAELPEKVLLLTVNGRSA